MAFSNGVFSRLYSWVTDRDNSVKIRADRMDAEMDGFATGLSACILKDGTQTITANIPFNGQKITGLGAGAANGDAIRYEQLTDGTFAITVGDLTIRSTVADATVGPTFTLHRNSASPADDDLIGEIKFDGEDDGDNQTTFARIYTQIKDQTDGTEDGSLFAQVMLAGTLTSLLELNSNGLNINDPSDPTKQLRFDLSGITTGQNRVITMPDANVNFGAISVAGLKDSNLLVNPFFLVSQENGDTQGSTTAYFMADQWELEFLTSAGALTIDRDASHPCLTNYPEIPYMLKVDVTTADASQAANEFVIVSQKIEGLRVKGLLNWGAAGGKDLLVGFLCRADYTGTASFFVRNSAGNRSYAHDFSVTANTDHWITVTIPEDVTGTWLETNGVGLEMGVCLGTGSDYQGTNDTWEAALDFGTSSTTDFLGTLGNTFWLGPMLAFPEGIPMPANANELHLFMRPFDRDYLDCLRYWQKSYDYDVAVGSTSTYNGTAVGYVDFNGGSGYTRRIGVPIKFDLPMRDTPTVTAYSPGDGGSGKMYDNACGGNPSATVAYIGHQGCHTYADQNCSANRWYMMQHWVADARL